MAAEQHISVGSGQDHPRADVPQHKLFALHRGRGVVSPQEAVNVVRPQVSVTRGDGRTGVPRTALTLIALSSGPRAICDGDRCIRRTVGRTRIGAQGHTAPMLAVCGGVDACRNAPHPRSHRHRDLALAFGMHAARQSGRAEGCGQRSQ